MGRYLDACELQCAADILLLTSDYEGMPKVILEAMAAGVPHVTNKVGAVTEQGANSFVAEPDMDNLVRYFVRLAAYADMRQAMKAPAQSAIERTYQSKQFARKPGTLCE